MKYRQEGILRGKTMYICNGKKLRSEKEGGDASLYAPNSRLLNCFQKENWVPIQSGSSIVFPRGVGLDDKYRFHLIEFHVFIIKILSKMAMMPSKR